MSYFIRPSVSLFLLSAALLMSGCQKGGGAGPTNIGNNKISCPTGFVPVPHNLEIGTTKDFCVMKYEAKAFHVGTETLNPDGCAEAGCTTYNWADLYHPVDNPTGHRPVSVPEARPWRRVNQNDARSACANLGEGYALISNEEWMTIARNIELVDENWSDGVAGTGILNRGWAYSNSAPASVSDETCLYNSAADSCASSGDHERKRAHKLSNAEEIWDFSGNVWDLVDWYVTPSNKAYVSGDGEPLTSWREFYDLDSNISSADEMNPPTWESFLFPSLGRNSGLGSYLGGSNISGGGAKRGGSFNSGVNTGAFALGLNSDPNTSNPNGGFRCVYRP